MANVAALPIMLKALRLACFNTHWESVAQKATAEQWMPEQYLAELCAMELSAREDKRLQRYHKESGLPPGKMVANFKFDAMTGVSAQQIARLTQDAGWAQRGENVLIFGASGLGKTHLAAAIGYDPNNGYVENYMFGDGIELHSLFADIWVMFGVGGIALALAIIVFTMRGVLHDIATGVASTVAMYLALRLLWDMAFSPWLSSLVLLPLAVGASLTDRVVARQQQETAGRR